MSSYLSKKIVRVSFILSVLVVCIHALNYNVYNANACSGFFKKIQDFFCYDIAKFAVPTFFALSGFLFFYSVKTIFDVFTKIKKRIFSLFIPFLIWNFIHTLIILIFFNLPFFSGILTEEAVGKVTIKKILEGIFLSRYSGHLWFIQSLIFFVSLTPLLFYIRKNKIVKYVFLVLCLLANMVIRLNVSYSFVSYIYRGLVWLKGHYFDFENIVFFFAGICLVDIPKFYQANKAKKPFSSVALVVLLILGIISNLFRDKYNINYLTLYPMIFSGWFAMDLFVTDKSFKIEKLSFIIYCAHYLMQRIFKKICIVILGNNSFSALFNYFIVNIVITILLIYIISLLLNKFLPKVFRVISGGRNI